MNLVPFEYEMRLLVYLKKDWLEMSSILYDETQSLVYLI